MGSPKKLHDKNKLQAKKESPTTCLFNIVMELNLDEIMLEQKSSENLVTMLGVQYCVH